jgi:S-adenosylmethionine:tRNA ribosyltransferase-isomerase
MTETPANAPRTFTLSDFDFALPPERIAQHPTAERSASRLLDGRSLPPVDRIFHTLPGLLQAGDLLVFNDTRVVKARLFGEKASGGKLELLIERVLTGNEVVAHMKVSKKPVPGSTVHLAGGLGAGGFDGTLLGRWPDAQGPLFRFALHGPAHESPWDLMERHGHLPLPPYIERQQHTGNDPDAAEDSQRYQTVFARAPGAVAAPTAALHFDEAVLADLARRGIERASVTLHVGAGTFQPVKTENLAEHQMHSEWYEVPLATLAALERCRQRGGHHAGIRVPGGGPAGDQLPSAQKHADDAGERLCGVRPGDGAVPPCDCAGVPVFQLRGCDAAGARRAHDPPVAALRAQGRTIKKIAASAYA